MPFDTTLSERVRNGLLALPSPIRSDMTEKNMFGGIAFLLRGKMTVGIIGNELVVRVLPEKMEEMLKLDYVRPMDFSGKPMKEFAYVAPAGLEKKEHIDHWIALGIEHARNKLNI